MLALWSLDHILMPYCQNLITTTTKTITTATVTTAINSGDSIEGELDGGELDDSPPQPCPELQVQQRIPPLLTYGAEHKLTEFFFSLGFTSWPSFSRFS